MSAGPTTAKVCAVCETASAKCWRCTPSNRPSGRALSGSDSSDRCGYDAFAIARAKRTMDDQQSSGTGTSSMSSDCAPRPRNRQRARRHRARTRSASTQSDSTTCSEKDTDQHSDRVLERYVPDAKARARVIGALTTTATQAREWYNARAIESRCGTDLSTASGHAEQHLSHGPVSDSAASVCPTPTADTPQVPDAQQRASPVPHGPKLLGRAASDSSTSAGPWSDGDPLRDVRGAINFCKSVLIGRYVQPHCRIMDLGCGHGQDVAKLAHARPRCVFFVDAADEPLAEAERRWRRTRFAFPAAFVQDDFCAPDGILAHRRVVVYRDDPERLHGQRHRTVADDECTLANGDGTGIVDAVTCQFAVQHAFSTRETARAFVFNVRRALSPGGVFLGVVADAERLWQLASRQCVQTPALAPSLPMSSTSRAQDATDGARARRTVLHLAHDKGQEARSHVPCALGIEGGGDPCPQHTVLFADLNALCVEAGLVLMASSDLAAFFDIESMNPRNASMLDRMKAPLCLNDPDDREHLALYRVFAFVRADRPAARPAAPSSPSDRAGQMRQGAAQRERPPCRVISYVWSSDLAANKS